MLIGASAGVAFVAMMKLSTHWFHPSRFALVAGLALGTGMLGAVSAGAPLRWLAGTTGGVISTGNMIGAMVMQPAVGWVLDRAWDGGLEEGMRVYSFSAYRYGFALMLAWLLAAVVVTAFTRETHCRQQQ